MRGDARGGDGRAQTPEGGVGSSPARSCLVTEPREEPPKAPNSPGEGEQVPLSPHLQPQPC